MRAPEVFVASLLGGHAHWPLQNFGAVAIDSAVRLRGVCIGALAINAEKKAGGFALAHSATVAILVNGSVGLSRKSKTGEHSEKRNRKNLHFGVPFKNGYE
jgi:hypothetical protein